MPLRNESARSIHDVVIANIDWYDLLVADHEFQSNAVRQIDGYRMQAFQPPFQSMQTQ